MEEGHQGREGALRRALKRVGQGRTDHHAPVNAGGGRLCARRLSKRSGARAKRRYHTQAGTQGVHRARETRNGDFRT